MLHFKLEGGVPLFLNSTSSSLLEQLLSGPAISFSKLLILLGFCLVAAIVARRFIDSMTGQVIRKAQEAAEVAIKATELTNRATELTNKATDGAIKAKEDAARATEAVFEATSEPGAEEAAVEGSEGAARANAIQLDGDHQKVLSTMNSSKYAMRALSGIVYETNLLDGQVTKLLSDLEQQGLVSSTTTPKGYKKWYLTGPGFAAANVAKP